MRKTISLLSIILLATALAGCGNDQYSIEKQSYQVQKKAEAIFSNPNASPPNQLKSTVLALAKFAKKYQNTAYGLEADFTIARLYMVKSEFDLARQQLRAIMAQYPNNKRIASESLFLVGNTYELQDKWALALEQYKKIMAQYAITPRGLAIPIYIAQHYKVKYQPDAMRAAIQEALGHYQGLTEKYPVSVFALNVYKLMIQCYTELKDWNSVIKVLDTISVKYTKIISQERILLDKASVYMRYIHDDAQADALLQKLVRDYPKSKYLNIAKKLLTRKENKTK